MEAISKKGLSHPPKLLQSLTMKKNNYDVKFRDLPGNDLKIADALSDVFFKFKK